MTAAAKKKRSTEPSNGTVSGAGGAPTSEGLESGSSTPPPYCPLATGTPEEFSDSSTGVLSLADEWKLQEDRLMRLLGTTPWCDEGSQSHHHLRGA